jgi:uncharacterized repeat protein (TIGR04076 family)
MSNEVKVEVVEIKGSGKCPMGIKVGDTFEFGAFPPAGLCVWATYVIFPFVTAPRFGGEFEEEEGVVHCCCIDPKNPVVFRLSRIVD